MPVLPNSKHEQFAQLLVTGKTPPEAYVAAGYASKTAYTCGPRLLKTASVQARVRELQQTVATAAVTRAVLDRAFVLRELMDNALQAKKNGEWSSSNRALELLGKELGLFSPAELPWDGDPATLTDQQLATLDKYLARIAFGGDKEKEEAARAQIRKELGAASNTVIEATTEPEDDGDGW